MTVQSRRRATGGAIDRSRPLAFEFDGKAYVGVAGDTLASALIANGVRLVGRSFKYHRPRGIYTAGPEEPNALVRLRRGARAEPNSRATMIELFDGLLAESQNRFPSLRFDLGAVASLAAPLIPAGFYYKTFMWPPRHWMFYERFIRRAAGLGMAPTETDPDRYEKRRAYCDVLIVGGGPAGLAAALTAARSGARLIVVDERAAFGGALHYETTTIEGLSSLDWAARALDELRGRGNVRLLPRATAYGYYDHNMVAVVERVADHLPAPPDGVPRQILWSIRAKQVILATGAIERPIVFGDNDRPGVMLASAARTYVNRFAALPGRRAVVFANNDSGYEAALDLKAAGIEIAATVDPRASCGSAAQSRLRAAGVPCLTGHIVLAARGASMVSGAIVAPADQPKRASVIECDLIAVSGGWSPTVHLHCQSGVRAVYDSALAAVVPGVSKQAERSAGAARGCFALAECLADGERAGNEAAAAAGFGVTGSLRAFVAPSQSSAPAHAAELLWAVPPYRRIKRFVDIQDDVTADDVSLAAREGFRSVQHLKRYTTLGMGTDQG